MLQASIRRLSCQIWKPLRSHSLAVLSQRRRKICSSNVSFAFERLTNRSIVRVSGNDALVYLQGLVTNDMRHLQEDASSREDSATNRAKAMYSMFLDARGRIILDSIIYKTWSNDKNGNKEVIFLVECDTAIESILVKHLKMYKLRKKVDISKIGDEMDVWVEFSPDATHSITDAIHNYRGSTNIIVCRDPRLPSLGVRLLCPKSESPISDNKELQILDSGHYMAFRYRLGIGEGIQDIPPGICFPLEANGDYLHGVSFHKGCYVGQELTARIHHTGVVRKRLMPLNFPNGVTVDISQKPETAVIDGATGKAIGKVRGVTSCGGIYVGLGLLRVSEAIKAARLEVGESETKTERPFWWPEEAPRDRKTSPKV